MKYLYESKLKTSTMKALSDSSHLWWRNQTEELYISVMLLLWAVDRHDDTWSSLMLYEVAEVFFHPVGSFRVCRSYYVTIRCSFTEFTKTVKLFFSNVSMSWTSFLRTLQLFRSRCMFFTKCEFRLTVCTCERVRIFEIAGRPFSRGPTVSVPVDVCSTQWTSLNRFEGQDQGHWVSKWKE